MKVTLLREAMRIARVKLPDHPQWNEGTYLHFSFAVLDGAIIGYGTNRTANVPIHTGYNSRMRYAYDVPKMHSEYDVWRKTRGLIRHSKFSLINIRLNRDGVIRNSEPCEVCSLLMPELGCNEFYHTNSHGEWSRLVL